MELKSTTTWCLFCIFYHHRPDLSPWWKMWVDYNSAHITPSRWFFDGVVESLCKPLCAFQKDQEDFLNKNNISTLNKNAFPDDYMHFFIILCTSTVYLQLRHESHNSITFSFKVLSRIATFHHCSCIFLICILHFVNTCIPAYPWLLSNTCPGDNSKLLFSWLSFKFCYVSKFSFGRQCFIIAV